MTTFALLRRDGPTAAQIETILGLPNERWTDLTVNFSLDKAATATVVLLLTKAQLVALAQITDAVGEPE